MSSPLNWTAIYVQYTGQQQTGDVQRGTIDGHKQISQNFAITSSLQLLIDPALNTVDGQVWIRGMRARLGF